MKPLVYNEKYDPIKLGKIKHIEYSIDDNGCWNCISHSKNQKGYIDICRNGKRKKLHRYVYSLEKGEQIPEKVLLMHSCDNPSCFNPEHLSPVTIDENNKDKTLKGRQVKGAAVHTAKLADHISDILADNRPQRVIAKQYGVYHSTIGRIKRGRSWANGN